MESPFPVKECTEVSPKTPVRVKKVEYHTKIKMSMKNTKVIFKDLPVLLSITKVCTPAINISHGTREAFSTGSQAQYPPKFKDSYAQAPPIIIPAPNKAAPIKLHLKASFTNFLYSPSHNAANDRAKGNKVIAKPRNNIGG